MEEGLLAAASAGMETGASHITLPCLWREETNHMEEVWVEV